jgi:alpha-beta hydrolase superfamily lysophospholipase
MIQHLAFSKNEKRFHEESPNAWICSDHNVVKAYDDDTACGFVFTLNGFQNLFTLISNVYDEDNWKLLNKQLPIFFIAGSDDPCIVNINKFHEAVRFMEKLGYEHVSSKLYPQMRHEILNERGKEEVYEDIQAFLKSVKTLHTSDLHK